MRDVKENGGRLPSRTFFNNVLMVVVRSIRAEFSVRLRRVIGPLSRVLCFLGGLLDTDGGMKESPEGKISQALGATPGPKA